MTYGKLVLCIQDSYIFNDGIYESECMPLMYEGNLLLDIQDRTLKV